MLDSMGITLGWDNLPVALVVILISGLGVGKVFRVLVGIFKGFTR